MKVLAFALIAIIGMPNDGVAHHSFAADFDINQKGTLVGEVTRVSFRNPHVQFEMLVENEDGSAEKWRLESHNVQIMRKMGWSRDTIEVGDRIEARGSLGRRGAKKLSLSEVVLPDGRVMTPSGGEVDNAYTEDTVNADPSKDYTVTVNRYPVDITGGWSNRYKFTLTVKDLTPKPTPFTEEGRRLYEAVQAWHDRRKLCLPSSLPRNFGIPGHLEIADAGRYYMFLGGGNVARRIWMDGSEPAADHEATTMGFSRGRWEDGVLVVETTHLLPGWLDGSGMPMSGEGTRVVEHYTPSKDRLTMERKMTIYDPYYTEPLVRMRGSARSDDLEIGEEAHCNPIPFIRELQAAGNLESYLQLYEE